MEATPTPSQPRARSALPTAYCKLLVLSPLRSHGNAKTLRAIRSRVELHSFFRARPYTARQSSSSARVRSPYVACLVFRRTYVHTLHRVGVEVGSGTPRSSVLTKYPVDEAFLMRALPITKEKSFPCAFPITHRLYGAVTAPCPSFLKKLLPTDSSWCLSQLNVSARDIVWCSDEDS